MEEKLSTIYLRDGRNALQYVMSLSEKYRQIATEAIFECLRLGYPLNDMEITGKAREMQRRGMLTFDKNRQRTRLVSTKAKVSPWFAVQMRSVVGTVTAKVCIFFETAKLFANKLL